MYDGQFKLGVACAPVTERWASREIGDPKKEALILRHFNSMTFENALKPAYNMAYWSKEAREDYLPFEISKDAKSLLDWCREKGMKVRGHVLVWHSQCADEIFCKEYKPVRLEKDPNLPFPGRLDPSCFVDRQTMLKRLKSYIYSLMDYFFSKGYADVIYAWDVVNEAIEPMDKLETGLRDTYWLKVIGEDFMYYAFKYAREAVGECADKYADLYDTGKKIKPALFYNDYCEWMKDRKDSILAALKRSTSEHGSILGEKLIDGIGLQAHLSDNNDIDEYIEALREYGSYGTEIQLTELDVKCTCTNINSEYYQAVFYKRLFEGLLAAKRDGINITSVTFWGLTDDTSWIPKADPLLFRGDLSAKKSFDAIIMALRGGDLGAPEAIDVSVCENGIEEGFEENADAAFFRGAGHLARIFTTDKEAHTGNRSLQVSRFAKDASVRFDISAFIGRKAKISFFIKTEDKLIKSGLDGAKPLECACVSSVKGWNEVSFEVSIPSDQISAQFYIETDGAADMYIDDIRVQLA